MVSLTRRLEALERVDMPQLLADIRTLIVYRDRDEPFEVAARRVRAEQGIPDGFATRKGERLVIFDVTVGELAIAPSEPQKSGALAKAARSSKLKET